LEAPPGFEPGIRDLQTRFGPSACLRHIAIRCSKCRILQPNLVFSNTNPLRPDTL